MQGRSSLFKSVGGGGQLSGEVTLKGKLIMYIMYKVSTFMFIELIINRIPIGILEHDSCNFGNVP